ncbi:hypothetical protein CS542_07090 [Pedobacter sp. IW39]|nr:hypothetical protein CS542_07090 [Pedobacter sp. IW39]
MLPMLVSIFAPLHLMVICHIAFRSYFSYFCNRCSESRRILCSKAVIRICFGNSSHANDRCCRLSFGVKQHNLSLNYFH